MIVGVSHTAALSIIRQVVAEHYGISVAELTGSTRARRTVLARRVAMLLMRRMMPGITLREVAEEVGRCGHWYAIEGIQAVESELSIDNEVRRDVEALRRALSDHQPIQP